MSDSSPSADCFEVMELTLISASGFISLQLKLTGVWNFKLLYDQRKSIQRCSFFRVTFVVESVTVYYMRMKEDNQKAALPLQHCGSQNTTEHIRRLKWCMYQSGPVAIKLVDILYARRSYSEYRWDKRQVLCKYDERMRR